MEKEQKILNEMTLQNFNSFGLNGGEVISTSSEKGKAFFALRANEETELSFKSLAKKGISNV